MSSSWPEELPGKPLDWVSPQLARAVTLNEWNKAIIDTHSPYPDRGHLAENLVQAVARDALSKHVSDRPTVASDPPERPTVTRAEFEAAKKVLDALPPGLYAKCSQCGAWATSGFEVGFSTYDQEVLCRGCR